MKLSLKYTIERESGLTSVTDEKGNVIKTYEYDSFGNEVYLRARYYQSEMGRFLTRDTYTGEEDEPESLHLYTYCENDGVNMVDPNGDNADIVNIG